MKFLLLILAMAIAAPAQAGITFHVKGSALDAFRATGFSTHGSAGPTVVPSPITPTGITGAFGNVIDLSGTAKRLSYNSRLNFPTGAFTILLRFAPKYTAGANVSLFSVGPASGTRASGIDIRNAAADDKICILMQDALVALQVNACVTAAIGTVTDQMMDLWITYDNSTNLKVFAAQNGNSPTQVGSTITASAPTGGARDTITSSSMLIGDGAIFNGGNMTVDEIVIWDSVQTPSSFGARSDYITDTAFDGLSYTDPGVANVNVGTTYTFAGSTLTGTKTTPATSDVKHGVTFGASLASTGTYRGADLYTDPGVANCLNTVTYTFDGASQTGTFASAPVNRVRSGYAYGVGGTSLTGTDLSTDPGIANVTNGTNYTINSQSFTGTFTPNCNSIPPATTDVRSGVIYSVDGVGYLGTLNLPTASNVKTGTTFDNGVAGTLVCTDPGQSNVASGIGYTIYSVAKTGTLGAITNNFCSANLSNTNGIPSARIVMTKGDAANLVLYAVDGDGVAQDLTGATFTSYMVGPNGAKVVLSNSKHTADIDQVTNKGKFVLALSASDTLALLVGSEKEILTKVTQGSSVVYYHGRKMITVLPNGPVN